MNTFDEILLRDQTTGKNILWANVEFGNKEIQPAQIDSIEPRWKKNREQQKLRTKTRAEIFTPPEVCKLQNELICDESDWIKFIDAKFLEITCGEAPYLVSRYNVVTGEEIPIPERVGLLDRKLRLVNSETKTLPDWQEFAIRAVQSIYGYDFQGDNLFLARRNVFETVKDYFREKFNREPPEDFLSEVATIISWNLWQMDGLSKTFSPPFTESKNLFGGANCLIMDWTTRKPFEFQSLVKGARR